VLFSPGQRVYNKMTGEEGTVVRAIDSNTYIVSVVPHPSWGISNSMEVLWQKSQIVRKSEPGTESSSTETRPD
jgi:hypothetical protein